MILRGNLWGRDPRRGDPEAPLGTYFPDWLLEPPEAGRGRVDQRGRDLLSVGGVEDKLVQTLGITSLSKSQVSLMAADLDAQVTAFRTRPLAEAGPFTFVAGRRPPRSTEDQGRHVRRNRRGTRSSLTWSPAACKG